LLEEHESALAFDFRHSCGGLSIYDIGDTISYGEALRLVTELFEHDGSHVRSDVLGWTTNATFADVATIHHADWYMNIHRAKDTQFIELPKPWPKKTEEADVTPERREELRSDLKKRSAFRNR
jgi:hypothetical protein